jgi:hypothetical protein
MGWLSVGGGGRAGTGTPQPPGAHTGTGTSHPTGFDPFPSSPLLLVPQHHVSCSMVTTHVWDQPMVTDTTLWPAVRGAGTVERLQQYRAPAAVPQIVFVAG